jgi:hypothetical protein
MPILNDPASPVSVFAPSVHVLTAEPDAPVPADLSFDAILRHFPGLAEAEAVCWTGSTAAGWGNELSDIDLFVLSDKELELPVDPTMETWPSSDKSGVSWFNWMGRSGDVFFDLQVWPTRALETVLSPFLAAEEPEFCGFTEYLQDFVYRISIGVPLLNTGYFEGARELIGRSSYRRALARTLKTRAENQLNDYAGQLAAGDELSARISALLAAHTTADHCLVLSGDLCRRPKWLLRRLDATPACGMSVAEFRSEVLDGARPGESDGDCATRTARWTLSHLIRVEAEALSVGRADST